MESTSLYLHIPFCLHRCGYCDFNTYEGQESLIPAYVDALEAELRFVARAVHSGLRVGTVFFGGGTPSLLSPQQVGQIMAAVVGEFVVAADAEITLEANPGTLRPGYLEALRKLGVNRVSLGVQSSRPEDLALMERDHGFEEAIQAIRMCREAGFKNVSIDLIYGLPGQRLEHWQSVLGNGLSLRPDHITLYALSIEHATPMQKRLERGLFEAPDPDVAADMYEWSRVRLASAGYEHYEISNWAAPGKACRHNLQYWRNYPYVGLGAGAHGYMAGVRTANVLGPMQYIERMREGGSGALLFPRTPATLIARSVGKAVEQGETMMMGLRLVREGVTRREFQARFSEDLDSVYPGVVGELVNHGLLEDDGTRIRLSARGQTLGNRVFARFI
jgi:oxygen-independent coproporphyrinogen-3 oxidase